MANCSTYSLFRSEAFKNNKLSGSFIDLLCTAINNCNDTEFKKNLVKLLGLPDSVLNQSQDYMNTVSNLEAYLDNLTDEALVELGNKIKDKFTKKESGEGKLRTLAEEDKYEANDVKYPDLDKITDWNKREIVNPLTKKKIKFERELDVVYDYWINLIKKKKGNAEKFEVEFNPLDIGYPIVSKILEGKNLSPFAEGDDRIFLHDLFLRHFFGINAKGDKIADNDFNNKIQDEKFFKQYLQELLGEIEPDIPADTKENLSIDEVFREMFKC